MFTSNRQQAIEQFQAAAKLDPRFAANNADWHDGLEDAIASARSALEHDPYSAMAHLNVGLLLFATGRLEQALAELRKVLELSPGAGWDRELEIARVLVALERYDEAHAAIMRLAPEGRDYGLAILRRAPGMAGQSDAALARLQTRSGDKMHSIRIAEALCMRGLHEEAFATLHRARDALERDESILARIGFFQNELIVSPFLGPLHRDRRWQELVAMPEGDSAEQIIERLWPSSRTAGIERPH